MKYNYFEPTAEIDSYIHASDLQALRGILVGIINRDPTFTTKRFDEALDYICNQNGISIWDTPQNIAGEYKQSPDKWDKDYYHKLLAWLSQNFTKEREQYIEKVGKYVYKSEYTWGKDEAENFSHPVTQPSKQIMKGSQSVIGVIILMLLLLVTTGVVMLAIESILVIKIHIVIKCLLMILAVGIAIGAHRKNS